MENLFNFNRNIFLTNLMVILILLPQSHFLHKIYSNALPFENMVLGDNEKL